MAYIYRNMYELEARYDSRASFYHKAHVMIDDEGAKYLRSYDTIVAEIHDGEPPIVYGWYSDTTGRHIKEFLKQEGFKAENKRQILRDYSERR